MREQANILESSLSNAIPLVEIYRNRQLESLHEGYFAVVKEGHVMWAGGDPEHRVFVRSVAKPMQALALLLTGAFERYSLTDADLAIACASHDGEDFHIKHVREILERAGVSADELECGPAWPGHTPTRSTLLRSGGDKQSIYHNCSGKHAGMLAVCKHKGWPTATYATYDHPLQQLILDGVAAVCEYPREQIGLAVDGCGAPNFNLPIKNLAIGYANLCNPERLAQPLRSACEHVSRVMRDYPELIGGSEDYTSLLCSQGKGKLICKLGAEAVYGVGVFDRRIGLALKCNDGSYRGMYSPVIEILRQIGVLCDADVEALKAFHHPPILNSRDKEVGHVQVVVPAYKHG